MNEVITIGVDLAKNVFQVHGVDAEGDIRAPMSVSDRGPSARPPRSPTPAPGEAHRNHPDARISPSHGLAPTVTVDMAHAEGFKPPQIRENLVKIGAKIVRHGRYVTFQLAERAPGQLPRHPRSLLLCLEQARRSILAAVIPTRPAFVPARYREFER